MLSDTAFWLYYTWLFAVLQYLDFVVLLYLAVVCSCTQQYLAVLSNCNCLPCTDGCRVHLYLYWLPFAGTWLSYEAVLDCLVQLYLAVLCKFILSYAAVPVLYSSYLVG